VRPEKPKNAMNSNKRENTRINLPELDKSLTVEQPIWATEVKCKYCESRFVIDATTVNYEDLRPPDFFVVDMQYYSRCPNCKNIYILNEIPSHVAVWIQTKLFTPK
jgi:hypothetical protein